MIAPVVPVQELSGVTGAIVRPAAGGAVVLSRRDPVSDLYRLVIRRASGAIETFPVPSRGAPFDVDVGPDVRGREVAVYSRCAKEPQDASPGEGSPFYRSGVRCRLYELSLATGRERRLHTPTERSGSDFLPTIWRGRLAWAHLGSGKLHLMLRDGTRTRRLRMGTPSDDRLGGIFAAPGVRGLDLRGDRLSLVRSYYDPHKGCGDDAPFGSIPVDELWSFHLGSSRRRVAHAGCPGDAADRINWAQLSPSGLSYTATFRSTPTLVGPFGRTAITLPPNGGFIQSFARLDDGHLAVAYDGSANGLAIG